MRLSPWWRRLPFSGGRVRACVLGLVVLAAGCPALAAPVDGGAAAHRAVPLGEAAAAAAAHGVRIVDWRGETAPVVLGEGAAMPADREAWVKTLSASLSNFALTADGETATFTLLPKGLGVDTLKDAKALVARDDIGVVLSRRDTAKPLAVGADGAPTRGLAAGGDEVKKLLDGLERQAARERAATLSIRRVVNPEGPAGGYGFRVRYDESAGRLVPFEKNGQPVSGAMEGFTSFSSVAAFLNAFSDSLAVKSDGEWTFFDLEGDTASVLAVKAVQDGYEVAARARPQNGPRLEYRLSGGANGYTALCRIQHGKGEVVLADQVGLD